MIFPFSFERSKTVFCSPRAKSRQTNRGRFISGTDTGCCSKFTSWTHFNPKGENGSEGKLERGIHLQCKTRANPTQVIEILQQLNKCAGKESLWIFLDELQFKLEEFWMQSQLIGIPLLHIFSFIWTCCATQSLWLICFCIPQIRIASALLGDSDWSSQWTSREPLSIDLYSRAGKSGFALCFGSAMLSPLCNLCGALNPITSADWLYLTPDNGINEFKDPPPPTHPKADKNGVICMQVTCSKRGKVRWIKMQFISFPVLWPNYVASFFHASKSHRIGLDGKAADSPLLCPDLN